MTDFVAPDACRSGGSCPAPKQIGLACAVGHKPPLHAHSTRLIHCRQPVLRHEVYDPSDMELMKGIAGHRERIGALIEHRRKSEIMTMGPLSWLAWPRNSPPCRRSR